MDCIISGRHGSDTWQPALPYGVRKTLCGKRFNTEFKGATKMYENIGDLIGEDELALLKIRLNEVGLFTGSIEVDGICLFSTDQAYTVDEALASLDKQIETYLSETQSA